MKKILLLIFATFFFGFFGAHTSAILFQPITSDFTGFGLPFTNFYPLDQLPVADDLIGNNPGTDVDFVGLVSGFFNNAYSFNGNSSVVILSGYTFDISDTLSVSLWFKYPIAPSSSQALFSFPDPVNQSAFMFVIGASDLVEYGLEASCVGGIPTTSAGIDTGWHHAVITYASGTTELYLDGNIWASAVNGAAGSCNTTTIENTLGDAYGYRFPYEGILDEFSIYNAVLSSSDVSFLYNAGSGVRMVNSYTPGYYYTDFIVNGVSFRFTGDTVIMTGGFEDYVFPVYYFTGTSPGVTTSSSAYTAFNDFTAGGLFFSGYFTDNSGVQNQFKNWSLQSSKGLIEILPSILLASCVVLIILFLRHLFLKPKRGLNE